MGWRAHPTSWDRVWGREEECTPKAGSPHVTSSCTDRYRTHTRTFKIFPATFQNCCGLLCKSCFPPFSPGASLTSYPVPLILCVSHVCMCVRDRQLVSSVHGSSDQEELYCCCRTYAATPAKPRADAIKAGGLGRELVYFPCKGDVNNVTRISTVVI